MRREAILWSLPIGASTTQLACNRLGSLIMIRDSFAHEWIMVIVIIKFSLLAQMRK